MGNPLNAQDYNGYSYCANNPLAFTDPSGYQKYATPEVYCIPGSEFYLNRIFGGGGGGGIGGGGDGGASGYSGMGSLDYGLPGQGQNGPGANGLYYDWVSGTMRSTATLEPVRNYETIDYYTYTSYTIAGVTTNSNLTYNGSVLKVTFDGNSAVPKAGGVKEANAEGVALSFALRELLSEAGKDALTAIGKAVLPLTLITISGDTRAHSYTKNPVFSGPHTTETRPPDSWENDPVIKGFQNDSYNQPDIPKWAQWVLFGGGAYDFYDKWPKNNEMPGYVNDTIGPVIGPQVNKP